MVDIQLLDLEGDELGRISTDEGLIPRKGEHIRITEGRHAGDYKVTFLRWRIPEGSVQVLCELLEKQETWPDVKLPETKPTN